jgi:predicted ATP-binding protein involved in virulence
LDDPNYKHFKTRLIRLTTAKEEYWNMYEKPLLNIYQTSSEPKQEREKQKQDEEKKSNCRSDKCGKKGESTHTPKGNWEKTFQNNRKALASILKLRSISTRQIRHPASTVDATATIP